MEMPQISQEFLVLVPVLNLIGALCKRAKVFPDEAIPLFLGVCGIVLASVKAFGTEAAPLAAAGISHWLWQGVTQGLLAAGAGVYLHQLGHQAGLAVQKADTKKADRKEDPGRLQGDKTQVNR